MKRIIFVFLCLLLAVSGFSQINLQPAATVNLIRSEVITVGQLRTEVERMEASAGRRLTQAERLQVLDVMINERLVMQAAERDRVTVTENELNQQIAALRNNVSQQLGRAATDAEYAQAVMNETGLDVTTFREQLRRQIIVQKYLQHSKGDLLNSVRVPTEQEIVAEFNIRRTQLIRPETIRFSMIQVPYGADAASRARARELATRLFSEISSNPSRFDEVAARSVQPNSGYQAGDAGYLPNNEEARSFVGQEFMNVAFSLQQGQVSRLIEGNAGFQIIKVTENYSVKLLELDDLIQLGQRVTVREYIGQFLLSQRQNDIVTRASQELVAELRANRTFQVFENNLNW